MELPDENLPPDLRGLPTTVLWQEIRRRRRDFREREASQFGLQGSHRERYVGLLREQELAIVGLSRGGARLTEEEYVANQSEIMRVTKQRVRALFAEARLSVPGVWEDNDLSAAFVDGGIEEPEPDYLP